MTKSQFLNKLEDVAVGDSVRISKENYGMFYNSPANIFAYNLYRTKRFKGRKYSVQSGRNIYILTRVK